MSVRINLKWTRLPPTHPAGHASPVAVTVPNWLAVAGAATPLAEKKLLAAKIGSFVELPSAGVQLASMATENVPEAVGLRYVR